MTDTERIARLDAIRKRVQAASAGPWHYTLIAHAREDIPWLLAEIERLEDQLANSRPKVGRGHDVTDLYESDEDKKGD